MNKRVIISFLVAAIIFLGSCAGESSEKPAKTPAKRRNIIILLDLSDRVIGQEQAVRDLAIIDAIAMDMVKKAKADLYIANNDRIQIVIAPQAYMPYEASDFQDRLECDMTEIALKEKRFIKDSISSLQKELNGLYAQASAGKKSSDYAGADIWRYLKEQVRYQFQEDERFEEENHLVILTDGYLNFESYKGKRKGQYRYASSKFVWKLAKQKENWKNRFEKQDIGFLPFDEKVLSGVHLHIAEVNPKADYHFEILEASWKKWGHEMGASSFHFQQRGLLGATTQKLLTRIKRGENEHI